MFLISKEKKSKESPVVHKTQGCVKNNRTASLRIIIIVNAIIFLKNLEPPTCPIALACLYTVHLCLCLCLDRGEGFACKE